MKVLTIFATPHKGNTREVTDLFLEEFKDDELDEIVLPNDFNNICFGCANCILKGEDKCPHYSSVDPILKKIEEADLLIIATPILVGSYSSGLKALLDHLAYIWLVHRPKESMFSKVGLIVTTAGGSGVKDTVKLLKKNLLYFGVPKVYNYGVTTMKMKGNYVDYNKKDKIKKQVQSKVKKINKSLAKRKVGFKTRFFYILFKMTQKNGWNKTDVDYWNNQGWLNGKKPY